MKRFGIAIPKEVASEVEKLSQELGVTRSDLIAVAVQEYLESRKNHADPGHQCVGAVLALSDSFSDVGEIIEEHKTSVLAYTHLHVEGKCLTILVVKGSVDAVERLTLELSKKVHVARYVPLM
ncbi:CopG family ribbon-helix-helix protein [Pyrobaculum sp.]|uniref:CopG family ribbon-helix-helix protein n=1 Tax=Pyrobaculum sp. TaxID=2004705 RepID=UPI003175045F